MKSQETYFNNFDVCAIDPDIPYIWNIEAVVAKCFEECDSEHKFIIFYYDLPNDKPVPSSLVITLMNLRKAIAEQHQFIQTTLIGSMSFCLREYHGYRIFLANGNKCVEIEPHMRGIIKDIRSAHNIARMAAAGTFNELLDIHVCI